MRKHNSICQGLVLTLFRLGSFLLPATVKEFAGLPPTLKHRHKGRGGEGGCSPPPKFWATQIFWAARENFVKASF